METPHDYLFKIILVGDSGVGKTSLMRRYTDNTFIKNGASTIGVDFKIKTVMVDGKKVKLQIWDTAGQERFKAIVAHYYRGANGIFLVFDLTSRDSFDHLKDWMMEIEKKDLPKSTEMLILANKVDDKEHRAVEKDEILSFLKSHNVSDANFYEVSALDNLNVEECFLNATKKMISKNLSSATKISKIPFKSREEKKRTNCC